MSDDIFDPFASDYSTEDVTSESVHEGGGGGVQIAGRYHVLVDSVEYVAAEVSGDADDSDKRRSLPHFKLQLQVLAGENESEVGKKIWHRVYLAGWKDEDKVDHRDEGKMFPLSKNMFHHVLAFLHAFGTVGDDVFGKESVKIDMGMFERLENTQAIVQVSMSEERTNEATGKTYKPSAQIEWNSDAWPLDHEKVADVPKSHEHATLAATGAVDNSDLDEI